MGRARKHRKRWKNLDPTQQKAVVVLGAVTSVFQGAMLWDLWRRPAEHIRGPKAAWVAASFARPVGQVAYLLWGRKPAGQKRR